MISRSLKSLLFIHGVNKPLTGQVPFKVFTKEVRGPIIIHRHPAGDMRAEKDILHRPQFAFRGQRLGIQYIHALPFLAGAGTGLAMMGV